MSKALFVNFIGEDGADCGGLTREFFPAVYEKVSIISQNNQEELEKREYEIFGKIISLALSSGWAGCRFLNSSVCSLLISTEESDVKPNTENLSEFELQEKLEGMHIWYAHKKCLMPTTKKLSRWDLDYNSIMFCQ